MRRDTGRGGLPKWWAGCHLRVVSESPPLPSTAGGPSASPRAGPSPSCTLPDPSSPRALGPPRLGPHWPPPSPARRLRNHVSHPHALSSVSIRGGGQNVTGSGRFQSSEQGMSSERKRAHSSQAARSGLGWASDPDSVGRKSGCSTQDPPPPPAVVRWKCSLAINGRARRPVVKEEPRWTLLFNLCRSSLCPWAFARVVPLPDMPAPLQPMAPRPQPPPPSGGLSVRAVGEPPALTHRAPHAVSVQFASEL